MIKLLVFPKDKNPYQHLLYSHMEDTKVYNVYYFPFVGSLPFLFALPIYRLIGVRIVHIHWQSFTLPKNIPYSKDLSLRLFMLTLRLLRLFRFKIVWTIHNLTPHEPQTANDLLCTKRLASIAHAKIIHSSSVLDVMKQRSVDIDHTHIIPHGNYIPVYNNIITREEARKSLGIDDNQQVILFFGNIRPYKGLEKLLEAVKNINNPRLHLVIAGKCSDASIEQHIESAKSSITITYHNKFIPDDDVQKYFNAADIVCLPFKNITTSGSALLALTFGKPLIAPNIGAIRDIPQTVGTLYDPSTTDALKIAIEELVTNPKKLASAQKASHEYAMTLNWKYIAADTEKIYATVLKKERR